MECHGAMRRTGDIRKSVQAQLLDPLCITRSRLCGVIGNYRSDMQGGNYFADGRLAGPALLQCGKRA